MLLICRLKSKLSSKRIPKSFARRTVLIVWLSVVVNGTFVKLDFVLSRIIALNLFGSIIISFFVIQTVAMLLLNFNISTKLGTVSPQADRVYYHQQSYT